MKKTKSLNLFAGLWFAAASCIPIIFIFLFSPNPYFSFTAALLFVVIPISVTFFFGFALGSDILHSSTIKNAKEAVIRGLKIAFLSYVVFVLLFALYTGIYQVIFDRNIHEFLIADFVRNFLFGLVLVGIFGTLTIGWLALIIGAVAGWILFKYRLASVRLRDA